MVRSSTRLNYCSSTLLHYENADRHAVLSYRLTHPFSPLISSDLPHFDLHTAPHRSATQRNATHSHSSTSTSLPTSQRHQIPPQHPTPDKLARSPRIPQALRRPVSAPGGRAHAAAARLPHVQRDRRAAPARGGQAAPHLGHHHAQGWNSRIITPVVLVCSDRREDCELART